jgi:glucose/arabinose dehydrogenase
MKRSLVALAGLLSADVEVGPEGALYVSDDEAGAVYRIRYSR